MTYETDVTTTLKVKDGTIPASVLRDFAAMAVEKKANITFEIKTSYADDRFYGNDTGSPKVSGITATWKETIG